MSAVDWALLRERATEAMRRAYAPYSRFAVGAAGLVDDGRVVLGCNVENASYGLGLCAECGLVSSLHATGGGRLVAVAVVDGRGSPLMPCGRCRQLLWENGGPDCVLETASGPRALSEVLPDAFGADALGPGAVGPGPGAVGPGPGAVGPGPGPGPGDRDLGNPDLGDPDLGDRAGR